MDRDRAGAVLAGRQRDVYLVLAASSDVGRFVVRALLRNGERVRAVAREPSRLRESERRGAEVLAGALRRSEWLESLLRDATRVVVAATGTGSGAVPDEQAIGAGETRRVIDAAARAGAEHVVLVSTYAAERGTTALGRVMRASEGHLEASGVPWTVLRPSLLVETEALRHLGAPMRAGQRVRVVGPGTVKLNWISAADVADDVVWSLHDPSAFGAIRNLRGRDHLSRLEVVALLEAALGTLARRRHLPLALARLGRAAARPVHAALATHIDLVLDEHRRGGDPSDAPEHATWVGPTRVVDVIGRWLAAATNVRRG